MDMVGGEVRTMSLRSLEGAISPGEVVFRSVTVDLRIVAERSGDVERKLIVAHAPETGVLWWRFWHHGLDSLVASAEFFASRSEIVGCVKGYRPFRLLCRSSSVRVGSLDDGLQLIRDEVDGSPRWASGTGTTRGLWTSIGFFGSELPETFWQDPKTFAIGDVAIQSVARDDDGWNFLLVGREGQRARVRTDDDFVLLGVDHLAAE